jgi:hypothetical protein
MNTTTAPDPQDLTCPKCGRPFEVSTIETEDGNYQRVYQCWHCFTSTAGRKVKRFTLRRFKPQEMNTQANL